MTSWSMQVNEKKSKNNIERDIKYVFYNTRIILINH